MSRVPLYQPKNVIGNEVINPIKQVINSGWLTLGEHTKSFEQNFATAHDSNHGIAMNSCTSALYASLRALGVTTGDQVIVPAMTFSATANVVRLLGAEVIICDVDDHGNMDPDVLEKLLKKHSVSAVIPVHLYGLPCDMHRIMELAEQHDVAVVEDCAHAPGATIDGEPVGSFGDTGCYSFYATKNMTTGEGGMAVTSDDQLAEKINKLRNHHQTKSPDEKADNWGYDVDGLGFNFRMSEIQAAMGNSQLEKLDNMNEKRRDVASRYIEAIKEIEGLSWAGTDPEKDHVYHLFVIRVQDEYPLTRDELYRSLSDENIITGVHYPPIPVLSAYDGVKGEYDHALELYDEILSIPRYPDMSSTDQETVISALQNP